MLYFPLWKKILISLVCVTLIIMAIPSLMSEKARQSLPAWLPTQAVNLGLDLQGGSHLLLRVDFDAYIKEQIINLVDETRTTLRDEKIGYRGLRASGNQVVFSLRDDIAEDVIGMLREKNPDIEISRDGNQLAVSYTEKWQDMSRARVLEQSLEIINRRINETGTKEPIIQRQGTDRIIVQVPGEADPKRVKDIIGKTAKMTFHLLAENVYQDDLVRGIAPPGVRLIPGDGENPTQYPVLTKVELSGDLLVDANATFDGQSGEPVVSFRFNHAGARKFSEITSANVGKPFAIVLDNKVITAPVIRSPILGGSGIISGNFTTQGANDLALLLRAGALPAPLDIIEERSVGPSLGQDSIEAGTLACLIGVGLVIIFMVVFYGLFGLFANITMLINSFMILALLALFDATLTLPGIAGIVLTVGMAVDANVLIFERMREEIRNGKSVFAAVEDGFKMAFGTIIDSNITTLSAALILYAFGTGTVKGFAVTLSIGIICSLFTSVLVTRMMVASYMLAKKPKTLPI